MLSTILDNIRISRPSNAVAAGTTDIKGTQVDMQADGGYDGVLFLFLFGALTATQVTSCKAQQSETTTDGDYADLAGTSTGALADGDGNKMTVIDVQNPQERYVRPFVDRGTANAVVDGIIAIQYRGRVAPITQPSDVAKLAKVFWPAEGTA